MNEQFLQYATLIMAMTLDFKLGKIDYIHYTNTLSLIADQMKELLPKGV